MEFSRKLLILFIVLIFIYIVFRLIKKRISLKQNMDNDIEGMTTYDNATVQELSNENASCIITIKNDLKERLDNTKSVNTINQKTALYLEHYAIKSSMNTAYNGEENVTDMISYVLSRGCRFIDFEIYKTPEPMSSDSIVSISKTSDFTPITQTTYLTLSEAMKHVNIYAFNSICPNYGDPIFVQFRPRDPNPQDKNRNGLKKILYDIYAIVKEKLSPLYSGTVGNKKPVKNTTSLKTLLGKIIVVMDVTLYPDYGTLCPELLNYVNMENSHTNGATETVYYENLQEEKVLKLAEDKYATNAETEKQVLFIDKNNVSYQTNVSTDILYTTYSFQMIPMIFWSNSTELYDYEMLFNNCGGGIVPLSCIYKKLINTDSKYIQYPEPFFASAYKNPIVVSVLAVSLLGMTYYFSKKKSQEKM